MSSIESLIFQSVIGCGQMPGGCANTRPAAVYLRTPASLLAPFQTLICLSLAPFWGQQAESDQVLALEKQVTELTNLLEASEREIAVDLVLIAATP
jgi:hypothetical protein